MIVHPFDSQATSTLYSVSVCLSVCLSYVHDKCVVVETMP